MSKIFNDIHFTTDYDFSLGSGLGALSIALSSKKEPTVKQKINHVLNKSYISSRNAFNKVSNSISNSKAVNKLSGSILTADGRAKSRLSDLLNPSNNNGIDLGTKLELSKLNSKFRISGVPESIIEKSTRTYLNVLESSGSPDIAKQFYLTVLRDKGVSVDNIIDGIKTSLGPQAAKWVKAAAIVGITYIGGKKLLHVNPSKSFKSGSKLLLTTGAGLAGKLISGAVRLIK